MWFVFGLASSLGFAIYAARRRLIAGWTGEPRTLGDATYEFKRFMHKGRLVRLFIAVECPDTYDFTVRRERSLDRFFVRVGLSSEPTVGDVVFDDNVYVMSDDARLQAVLRREPALRDALFALIHEVDADLLQVRCVRCLQGRIWVDAKPGQQAQPSFENSAQAVLASLRLAASLLERPVRVSAQEGFDRSVFPAAVLLGIASGLAINGGLQLLRLGVMREPFVLDGRVLMASALVCGLLTTVALLIVCVVFLRGSARAHVVALELLLVGLFGCVATSYAELRDFNIEADAARPIVVDVPIRDRSAYRCGKGGRQTCRVLRLQAFDGLPQQELRVSAQTYERFMDTQVARLTIGPGRLGFRWLRDVQPADGGR